VSNEIRYLYSAVINRKSFYTLAVLLSGLMPVISSCKKEDKPPVLSFRVDPSHTSTDVHVAPGTTLVVGVICEQGTDPMKLVYSEVAYDGANVDSLYARHYVPDGTTRFEMDFTITTRNETGTERWTFNVNDRDGRLTEKEIRIVCQ
jgi:hypothetical protein